MTRPYAATPEQYRACANAGMTPAQTAAYLRVDKSTVTRFAAQHPEIAFRHPKMGRPSPFDGMTADQRRDVETLMKRGKYTFEEAVAIVMRPRVKILAASVKEEGAA